MEKLLKPYDKECMRMAILKHEETFKEQVYELHRLYHIQKILMKSSIGKSRPKGQKQESWNLKNETSFSQLNCHQHEAQQFNPQRKLDLEQPAAAAEEYIADTDGDDGVLEIIDESEIELTLGPTRYNNNNNNNNNTTNRRKRGEELSAELSVALQCCLLGGKSGSGAGIDLSSLVVVEGKICWDLYIDGLVVSSDGNLLDALGAAIKAALSNTGIPKVNVAAGASGDEQPEVDVSDEEFLQFDTSRVPVIVTLTKVGRHYIVDATSEEESQMSSAVSISINRQGHICGLTKRGGAGLDPSIILDMISVAKTVSEQLINTLDSHIDAAEAGEEES